MAMAAQRELMGHLPRLPAILANCRAASHHGFVNSSSLSIRRVLQSPILRPASVVVASGFGFPLPHTEGFPVDGRISGNLGKPGDRKPGRPGDRRDVHRSTKQTIAAAGCPSGRGTLRQAQCRLWGAPNHAQSFVDNQRWATGHFEVSGYVQEKC